MLRSSLAFAWSLFVVLVALAGTLTAQGRASAPAPARRPNVLVLLADDLRRDAVGVFGGDPAVTPALDALAARGTALSGVHCMGSRHGAVCAPSRAMLLTGRALPRAPDDLTGCTTLPELLRQQGYTTWACGKWHNGEAGLLRAFPDANRVFRGGMADHFHVPLCDVVGGEVRAERLGDRHSSELFADAAIAFLRDRAAARDRPPFCAWVAFTAPHDPRDPPPEWLAKSRALPRPELPANFRAQHGLDLGPATMAVRDENLLGWPRDPELLREQLIEYRALVMHLDAQIGRILEALAASGLQDDTLVVFASDHGLALGSHGLLGKQSLYEHSMGTPVVLAGPGVPVGARRAGLAYLHDLMPTVLAAAGAPLPADVDGQDLGPLLRGANTGRDELLLLYADSQRALHHGGHELIRLPAIDRTLLFDLTTDPHELHDLAGSDAARDIERELGERLRAAQQRLGDALPWTAASVGPATIDMTGKRWPADALQPAWIRAKYFGAR